MLDKSHDLSNPLRQQSLHEQLSEVDFICAAFDCSTKSRAREIPRRFEDGRPCPAPLRSEEHPDGLPTLQGRDLQRVRTDNQACEFILEEIRLLAERGGGSVRENPWRSLHWWGSTERAMMATGRWKDKRYDACCLGGARCKAQCLRHNIHEIEQWPPLTCHHSHAPHEWTPYLQDGQTIYPSKEEAEYTAVLAFAIAVAASWWAGRVGRAKLHVPRLPQFECVGAREHWLDLDPRALREWAMAPLALGIGLYPPDPSEAARVPRRAQVDDVLIEKGKLPHDHVYVGQGRGSHRLAKTKWASPVIPGLNSQANDWLWYYVAYLYESGLVTQLQELQGKVLVCDCPFCDPCEADVLAGLCFEASHPQGRQSMHRFSRGGTPPARQVLLASMASTVQGIPTSPTRWWSQEALVLAFRKLYPAHFFMNFQFPMVEDIINAAPFNAFPVWLHNRHYETDGPLGPHLADANVRQTLRTAEGQQVGALNQRAALPPLLSYDLSPDEHFAQALARGRDLLPTELPAVLDLDLAFAADCHTQYRGRLRDLRRAAVGALRELHRRWCAVGRHLRQFQPVALQATTATRDLGFVALLILLTSWPDVTYPFGLIEGLPAVGYAPCYGVFPSQPAERITLTEVLAGCEAHNHQILSTLKPGKDDLFLLEQSTKDAARGFCTPPLTLAQLRQQLQGQPYRLIPRCVITQSSGKQRIIDNADAGGQTLRSADANKLVLCSPLRPAQHISQVLRQMSPSERAQAAATDTWETGGEDWPDAYRHSPMGANETRGCVVTFWHHEWAAPAFQVYAGLLFGLPLAVTSFNRYSRLVEALGRRLCYVLVSLYFDDASIQDWSSSRGSAQWAFGALNQLLGTPFAAEKRQAMRPKGLFLGLDHDLSSALSGGFVSFWARERLETKLKAIIHECRATQTLKPGVAAKLYGLANFFEQGVYGRIGCGGLHAIKERQLVRGDQLTPAIEQCFQILEAVLSIHPERELDVWPRHHERFVAASDAALETPGEGTGGFLLVFFHEDTESRLGFVS